MEINIVVITAFLSSAALIALRYVKVAAPLYEFLPLQYRWLPATIAAVAGVVAQQVGGVQDWSDLGLVVILALGTCLVGAQPGAHAPVSVLPGGSVPPPPKEVQDGDTE
jgi:hypothetical protein